MMVSFAKIQNLYNDMYAELRNYIWDFPTVAALADLEIEVYRTCQDLDMIRSKFYRLRSEIFETTREDEDLQKAVDDFEDILSTDGTFVKLNQVDKVVQK